MKVYFPRHQAAGILTDYPFEEPPTAEQTAPLLVMLRERHGEVHPKTGAAHWTTVVSSEVLAPSDVPKGQARVSSPKFSIEGEGVVLNPEDVGVLKVVP